MAGPEVYSLPLFKSVRRLPLVPGLPNSELAVADASLWPGPGGLGYVVREEGFRRVSILGWASGRALWLTDRLLEEAPQESPFLRIAADVEGDQGDLQLNADGFWVPIARWARDTDAGGAHIPVAPIDLGPMMWDNAGLAPLDLLGAGMQLLSVAFEQGVDPREWDLGRRFRETPRVSHDRVFDCLMEESLPDALETLVWDGRPSATDASPLQRAISRWLEQAGWQRVRPVAAAHSVSVAHLATSGLWWVRMPKDLAPPDRTALLAVEAVLNRAQLVIDAHGEACVTLDPTPENDELLDLWGHEALSGFLSQALEASRGYEKPNPLLEFHGAAGTRGGVWDIQTRFAQRAERLRLPFRMNWRLALEPGSSDALVQATVPDAGLFSDEGPARETYGLRLATLLAACAFGASAGITDVTVTLHEGSLRGGALLAQRWQRRRFLREALPQVQDGTLPDPTLTAERLRALLPCAAGDDAPRKARVPLWDDQRPLPPDLVPLLRADRLWELDVFHDSDPDLEAEFRAIHEEDAPLIVRVMELEELRDRIEARAAARAREAHGRVPAYFSDAASRYLVGLLPEPEEAAVGAEALWDPGADSVPLDPETRYWQVPDAWFDCTLALARAYRELGDAERAEGLLDQLVTVAPTSAPALLDRAVLAGEQGRWTDAVADCATALENLLTPNDCGFALYRLAYAWWQLGEAQLAAAAYELALPCPTVGNAARRELDQLLAEAGLTEPVRPEAEALLAEQGIELPPQPRVVGRLCRSLVSLTDAGASEAASHLAYTLALALRDDDLLAVSHSLKS